MLRSLGGRKESESPKNKQKPADKVSTHSENSSSNSADNSSADENRSKRMIRGPLTEQEYEFIANDIMAKQPPTNYLKYRLPLRYAARTDEVRWEWKDERTGRLIHRELIGGGRNSDLSDM